MAPTNATEYKCLQKARPPPLPPRVILLTPPGAQTELSRHPALSSRARKCQQVCNSSRRGHGIPPPNHDGTTVDASAAVGERHGGHDMTIHAASHALSTCRVR